MNLALKIANRTGGLGEWEFCCGELADQVLHARPDGQILWVDLPGHPKWRYHMVAVVDGVVHDAWRPNVMEPPAQYVRRVFGPAATWDLMEAA